MDNSGIEEVVMVDRVPGGVNGLCGPYNGILKKKNQSM